MAEFIWQRPLTRLHFRTESLLSKARLQGFPSVSHQDLPPFQPSWCRVSGALTRSGGLWMLWSNRKQPHTWESWTTSHGLTNEQKLSFKFIITPLAHPVWATGREVGEGKDFLAVCYRHKENVLNNTWLSGVINFICTHKPCAASVPACE